MRKINLNQDKNLILDILKCNIYHIEDKINNTKLLTRGTDYAQLSKVQHLFNHISSSFNISLSHNGLRELFYNLFYIDGYSNLKFKNRIRINKLSVKVATLFIKSCSKHAVIRIANIIANNNPNESDLRTILTL